MPLTFALILLGAGVWFSGCGPAQSPPFPLNLEGRDPRQVTPAQREAITKALEELFGTSSSPKVPEGVPLRLERLQLAAGAMVGDARGNQHGLFLQHCVSCHGVAGDGAGPAASTLDPYPRDFRRGIFKYTSTAAGAKPTRDDLYRSVVHGIAGTGMPSHAKFSEAEIQALIDYVEYLSIRGQTEAYLVAAMIGTSEGDSPIFAETKIGTVPGPVVDIQKVRKDCVLPAAQAWAGAERAKVVPPSPPPAATPAQILASVALGHDLYLSKDAQCVRCHGPQGAGDGEEKDLYDDWNKPKQGATPEQARELAGRFTLPIQRLRPRNFRDGVFHGGSSPQELYLRILVGIKGTPMVPTGTAPDSTAPLTPEQIWHVVDYVRSLSRR